MPGVGPHRRPGRPLRRRVQHRAARRLTSEGRPRGRPSSSQRPAAKPETTSGVAVSNPTMSSIPGSLGSAIVKPFETIPTTTRRAGIPVRSRYCAQRLHRVDVTRPGLGVGVDHERVDLAALREGVEHRQRAVRPAERQVGHRPDRVVQALARADRQRRQPVLAPVVARVPDFQPPRPRGTRRSRGAAPSPRSRAPSPPTRHAASGPARRRSRRTSSSPTRRAPAACAVFDGSTFPNAA